MKRFLVSALTVTLLMVGLHAPVAAQDAGEWRTAAVMTMRSYQNFLDDMQFFGGSVALDEDSKRQQGERFMNRTFPTIFRDFLQAPKELDVNNFPGLDKSRPLGGVVLTDGLTLVPIALIPITDGGQFTESAKLVLGDVIFEEAGDNLYEMGRELTYFVKIEGDWAYIAQSEQNLEYLPNPTEVMGNLPQLYDSCVKVNMQEFPRVFADMMLDMMARDGGLSLPGAPSMTAPGGLGQLQAYLLAGMFNEVDQVIMGTSLDEKENIALMETTLIPIKDSTAAKHFADMKGGKTSFGSLIERDSMLMGQSLLTLDEGQIERLHEMVNTYENTVLEGLASSEEVQSEEERQALRELLTEFVSVARATVDSGNIDAAMRLVPAGIDIKPTLVFGAKVSDGERLEAALKKFVELGKGDPGVKKAATEVATYKGVKIHGLQLAELTSGLPYFDTLGPEPTILLAYSDGKVFFAAGDQAMAQIQGLINGKEAEVPPMQGVADVRPLMALATQSIEGDMAAIATNMTRMYLSAGDPTIRFSVTPLDDSSLKIRAESGDGILKLSAALSGLIAPELLKAVRGSGLPLPF